MLFTMISFELITFSSCIFFCRVGAMIACKLAALVPDRVLSLALLNVTDGGYECFPKVPFIFCSMDLKHSSIFHKMNRNYMIICGCPYCCNQLTQ